MGVKEKYQPLYQKLILTMANPTEVDTIWGKHLNTGGVNVWFNSSRIQNQVIILYSSF